MAHWTTNEKYVSLHAPNGTQYSTGNTKIGHVFNTSVDADRTCPADAPCRDGLCYFCSLCGQRPNVLKAATNNGDIRIMSPAAYLADLRYMVTMAAAAGTVFRIHVGGDFEGPDGPDIFAGVMQIARDFPGIIFGMTKAYNVVNEYIRTHGGTRDAVLKYMFLRFSPWPGYPMENSYNMPLFGYTTDPNGLYTCPEQAAKIHGVEWDCTRCRDAGIGCFADADKMPWLGSIDHNAEQREIRRRRAAGLPTFPKKEKK